MRIASHRVFRRPWFRCLLALALICGGMWIWNTGDRLRTERALKREIDAFRAELRRQGFKTEGDEIGMPLTAEDLARLAVVTNLIEVLSEDCPLVEEWMGQGTGQVEHNESEVPEAATPTWRSSQDWREAAACLDESAAELDAMRDLLLDRKPLRFSWKSEQMEYHPAPTDFAVITRAFNTRMALALHAGRREDAWTNLLAVTGLAAGYECEPLMPTEIGPGSLHVALMNMALSTTWEAMQTNGWSDAQLEGLERLWREVDIFRNRNELPLYDCQRHLGLNREYPECADCLPRIVAVARELAREAKSWDGAKRSWRRFLYFLSHRDRWPYTRLERLRGELAILHRVTNQAAVLRDNPGAGNWKALMKNPAINQVLYPQLVTNPPSLLEKALNLDSRSRVLLPQPAPHDIYAAQMAEAEGIRRVLLAALAVERAKLRLGRLPATLVEAGFPDNDFMTGDPLVYRPEPDGNYMIYSSGIDLIDQGGRLPELFIPGDATDIVWPRCAREDSSSKSNGP